MMSALSGIDIALWDLKGWLRRTSFDFVLSRRRVADLLVLQRGDWVFLFMNFSEARLGIQSKSMLGLVGIVRVMSKSKRKLFYCSP